MLAPCGEFQTRPGLHKIHAGLLRVNQPHFKTVRREDAHDAGIEAVDVGGVVLLLLKHAVFHLDLPPAVHEVRCVRRGAHNPFAARWRRHVHLLQENVGTALGNDAHPATMVDGHIRQANARAVRNHHAGKLAHFRTENENVPCGGGNLVQGHPHLTRSDLLRHDTRADTVKILCHEGRFTLLRIKRQQTAVVVKHLAAFDRRLRAGRFLAIGENQHAVDGSRKEIHRRTPNPRS